MSFWCREEEKRQIAYLFMVNSSRRENTKKSHKSSRMGWISIFQDFFFFFCCFLLFFPRLNARRFGTSHVAVWDGWAEAHIFSCAGNRSSFIHDFVTYYLTGLLCFDSLMIIPLPREWEILTLNAICMCRVVELTVKPDPSARFVLH